MHQLKKIVLLICLLSFCQVPQIAADVREGYEAYKKGDFVNSLKEFQPLADQGDADAQYYLGLMFARGKGVSKDYIQAVNWYTKAAEQGHTKAQHNLGFLYASGQGVVQDYTKAYAWWNLAALQGDEDAKQNRDTAENRMSSEQIDAAKMLSKQFSKKSDVNLLQDDVIPIEQHTEIKDFHKGLKAYQEGDYKTALKEFQPLVNQGNAEAQYYLGLMFKKGQGVKENHKQGDDWLRKAAEQGHSMAQYNLGLTYEDWDYKETVNWYTKAAEHGNSLAQHNLGHLFDYGRGVPIDRKQAVEWYTKAAMQGNVEAQNDLGFMHYKGRGVPQDLVHAYTWWSISSSQGYENAKISRDKIIKEMPPNQIAEGKELSEELCKKITNCK